MIRILFFVAVILALGLGFAWLADRPGEMVLTWQGQRLETSLLVGIAALVALVAAILVVWWLLKAIFTSPDSVRRHFRLRRKDKGYQALSAGLIAAGAGDKVKARKMARRSRSLLDADREPLVHVLEAQTYMIEGRHDDARAKFEAMAENKDTRSLGLRGLYLEARRLDATEAAQHYAERAVEGAPQLSWAGQALLEYQTREGRWTDAIRLLERQRASRLIDKTAADRKRAVLLTARAMERLEADPRSAGRDAKEAVSLAPTLVPAAVTAAQAYFRLDDLKRGAKLLEKSWKASPHPEIADSYVRARTGDSVLDRLKRARKLDALKPNHVESLRIVAKAAYEAHEYDLARKKAEAALRAEPRESFYLLLADIEEADTGDQGRIRHWMSHALRAQRDPAWTADGYVSETWAPVSPVTGAIDAFVWKVPVSQAPDGRIDHDGEATNGARAIEALPPVRTQPDDAENIAGPADGLSTGSARPRPELAEAETAPDRTDSLESEIEAAKEMPVEPSSDTMRPPAAQSPLPAASAAPAEADAPSTKPDASTPATAEPEAPALEEPSSAEPRQRPEPGLQAGAVVIPLQTPAKPATEKKNAPDQTVAVAKTAPDDAQTEPASAATTAGDEAKAKPKEKVAGTSPDPEAGRLSITAVRAERQVPDDPDREKEEHFMRHRIDDPGVKETEPEKPQASARFRLF